VRRRRTPAPPSAARPLTPAQDARGDQCDACAQPLDPVDLLNPRCLVDSAHVVTRRPTAHMYARFDALQPALADWIRASWAAGKWSPNATINADGEIVDERMRAGLRPSPLTRDLQWGVPVPVDEEDEDQMKGKVLCQCAVLVVPGLFADSVAHRRLGTPRRGAAGRTRV
jgi:methionyl-tRNA synthetase